MMQSRFCDNYICHFNIKILNQFDPELQPINTKPIIKNKFKKLLTEMKKFKVPSILVIEYKKRNDCKISHSSAKLIASNLDKYEAFKSMHQSIISKIKNSAAED